MRWLREHDALALTTVWFVLSSLWLVSALDASGAPGMFYDEAWLAQQARGFVDPEREGALPPGTQSLELFGRPLPLFALPYLGSLKSQLLIPWLFAFGNDLDVVRLATLANAAAALAFTMFATRRLFGAGTAALAGVLLASDPTVFFHAQWEWGPFTTGWLCRAAGAALLVRSYFTNERWSACVGAFALGLSGYNRADSVLVLASVGLALLVLHRDLLARVVAERAADLRLAFGCFLLGALPVLLNVTRVLGTFGRLPTRGDFAERVDTFLATLDGSYAHRLMEVGGRFDAMAEAEAPFGLLGVGLVVALVATGMCWRRARSDGRGALAIACVVLSVAMLALEGATRAHHTLNLAPFVHVFIALCITRTARSTRSPDTAAGAPGWAVLAAGLCTAALLASNIASIASTRALIERTGGRGWWSGALNELASQLERTPAAVAVSFDWGFHLPLLFLTTRPVLIEPIWEIERAVVAEGGWSLEGDARHVYIVHEPLYDRFGYGPRLLVAARTAERAGRPIELVPHRDREGATAFVTIRIDATHRIVARRGSGFRIEFDR